MADNSAALSKARRHDSQAKQRRASQAIQSMVDDGEPVTFPAVARRAGVSVSLLYAHPDLAGRIVDARARQRQAGIDRAWLLPTRSLVTEQSLRADLANAREQIRQLTDGTAILRARMARDLGADADIARGRLANPLLDQLEQRSAELEADNHRLRRQVTELEAEAHEHADTLQAARAMNRELMSELNRSTPSTDNPTRPRSPRRQI
ncbi:MAG: DUF6262 family protein [Actinomycetota bacterium]|nr:DUF6262 family protein [Actinomycetota bacterium]